ncbi:hypothetical protein P9847_12140 [Paenibacillus chibensis]|uniref:Uncharacterized protein n=1 Tax=Paenibacillus chibensis TaxID=59846 RepID=A0ABU6PTB7_9BACL|nr:hypothetical protein [Paenibacillus chibensis]MEC0371440.1 hypothetical protein [Paenibacillus chibensis]MED5018052.1 hypothetical protein [Paenibacillus chibensis]
MDTIVKRYYQLKEKQRETEQELKELREQILAFCTEKKTSEFAAGPFRVKLISQSRKEYDDAKLYEALPDLELWRLLSKSDASKIAGLIKLGVIQEDRLQNTYDVKQVTLLQVDKK